MTGLLHHQSPPSVPPGRTVLLAFLAAFVTAPLHAADQGPEDGPQARMVVDFAATMPADAWVAAAWEQNVYRDLAGFSRLQPVPKGTLGTSSCEARERTCLLGFYGDAGVDVVILGALSQQVLRFDVYQTWTRSLVERGVLNLGEARSLEAMRRETLRTLKPFLESGGLLEQKRFLQRVQGTEAPAPADPARPWLVVALVVAWVALLLPLVLPRLVLGRGRPRGPGPRWHTYAAVGGLAVWLLVVVQPELLKAPEIQAFGAVVWPVWRWASPGMAGLAWGLFVLLTLRWALPSFKGLERIRYGNVTRLVGLWINNALMRLGVAGAVYGGLAALTLAWMARAQLPVERAVLILPAVGLGVHYCFLVWVVGLAQIVDGLRVEGRVGADNPWHLAAMKYFRGYVRRTGLPLGERTLRRVLIFPGDVPGVVSYGGGLTPTRVVVNSELLETALGPLHDDPNPPPQSISLNDWWVGTVAPTGAEIADTLRARPGQLRGIRKLERRAEAAAKAHRPFSQRKIINPRLVGQNVTLLGYVLPLPGDESVPLISDDDDDFGVVRELLTDHYAAFDPGTYGEEYDDTDPTQKDFLFGVLLREMGSHQRRDTWAQTWWLALAPWVAKLPAVVQRVGRTLGWLVAFPRRWMVRLGDMYPVLNLGRDAFIQYLHLRYTGNDELLTARADTPRLQAVSQEALDHVLKNDAEPPEGEVYRRLRERMQALARFVRPGYDTRGERLVRWALRGAWTVALVTWGVIALREAIAYHPIYVERLAEQTAASKQDTEQDQREAGDGKRVE